MRFIGAIAFLGSAKEDRVTNAMTFEVMVDWTSSVREYYEQEVMLGEYDGSEVLISVYEYRPLKGTSEPDWNYDSEGLIDVISISNPY